MSIHHRDSGTTLGLHKNLILEVVRTQYKQKEHHVQYLKTTIVYFSAVHQTSQPTERRG
jgi:hypothetical protein